MNSSILDFFVSSALADTQGVPSQPPANGGLSLLTMGIVFFIFIYFTAWRPQAKRAKEQRTLLDSLTKGDEVMTAGGVLGRITKMNDHYVGLSVSNNVDIWLQKTSIVTVLPKGTLKAIE